MGNPLLRERYMYACRTPSDIYERVEVDASGCWLWRLSTTQYGYGQVTVKGRNLSAHRWVYERLVGPIPSGLQLDHLCRVRHCVNPDHLEPVTPRENVLRGEGAPARNAVATHCPKGHPYDDTNTYVYRSGRGRGCKECRREAVRRRRGRLAAS